MITASIAWGSVEPMEFPARLSAAIADELYRMRAMSDIERVGTRLHRYRRIGL
jgi:acetyl-CoA carboxylase carboxyl transferase subunit beta